MVDEGIVKVHYEGNIYNAVNIRTFKDRCMLAAGRARDNYPTTSFMAVPTHDLIVVGTYSSLTIPCRLMMMCLICIPIG
jgi:hypothetical protein